MEHVVGARTSAARARGVGVTADYDEKTRVTQVVQQSPADDSPSNDCLVVIYTAEPGLLGKRFVLDKSPTRVGRGADSQIVLEGDSVSRRHAHLERRAGAWYVVDDGSTNGTYVNEEQITREQLLVNGDRIKVGPSILKFLSGADAEAKYHEEIYRMTIVDGLTQIHNKRYLFETLERELTRARRYERPSVQTGDAGAFAAEIADDLGAQKPDQAFCLKAGAHQGRAADFNALGVERHSGGVGEASFVAGEIADDLGSQERNRAFGNEADAQKNGAANLRACGHERSRAGVCKSSAVAVEIAADLGAGQGDLAFG